MLTIGTWLSTHLGISIQWIGCGKLTKCDVLLKEDLVKFSGQGLFLLTKRCVISLLRNGLSIWQKSFLRNLFDTIKVMLTDLMNKFHWTICLLSIKSYELNGRIWLLLTLYHLLFSCNTIKLLIGLRKFTENFSSHDFKMKP